MVVLVDERRYLHVPDLGAGAFGRNLSPRLDWLGMVCTDCNSSPVDELLVDKDNEWKSLLYITL